MSCSTSENVEVINVCEAMIWVEAGRVSLVKTPRDEQRRRTVASSPKILWARSDQRQSLCIITKQGGEDSPDDPEKRAVSGARDRLVKDIGDDLLGLRHELGALACDASSVEKESAVGRVRACLPASVLDKRTEVS
jgi:hypothetical protein